MDPYQAKLFGLYCLLLFVKLYCDYYEIKKGKVELACDCLSAVTKGLLNKNKPKVSEQNHNLLLAIFELRTTIPIDLVF